MPEVIVDTAMRPPLSRSHFGSSPVRASFGSRFMDEGFRLSDSDGEADVDDLLEELQQAPAVKRRRGRPPASREEVVVAPPAFVGAALRCVGRPSERLVAQTLLRSRASVDASRQDITLPISS